ncbi:MAG: hypothetical protein J5710_14975, partial [Treponema sp.]|nr:hypothetical protein [Treponema sp.]
MNKSNKNVTKLLFSVIITAILLFAGSCQNWMSNDDFMQKIENEVHDANATQIKVYVRYANQMMGTTEPSGNTTMKVDVASRISAITNDDYGFVRWAAFTTKDFPTGKQHSSLLFVTEEDYNTKYKPLELPDSLVHFVSPTSPTTEVKIFTSQNDIFIIPIVAARPAYVQSVPAAADSNIVKNTSIRILFSKPIDEKSLYDDEGNLNYSITTSTSVFSDDETEMVADDITDKFVHKLSDSGKMLTLSLKTEIDEETQAVIKQELLDNRQRITVTLFEGICDRYGYSMNGSFSFNFQTGTNTDSLAPMIEVIYGGTGDVCDVFVTFGEDFKMAGNATKASKAASKTDVASEEYTDELVAQRVYDKLNIFVKANDIIASGSNEINPAKDLSEDNVATIGISASLFYDKDGKPIQINKDNSSEFSIGKKNYIYISGAIDKDAEIDKLFTEVAPLDKDGNKYTGGTIYTYDVSSLPDGLIRIDVWGIDMTGNSGETDKGAPYVDKHDNGFKSIFVVKDTTPIDSNEVKAKKKVVSNSISAPYYWYNNDTLKTMQLFDTQTNKITDYGHVRLRSLDENLYWYFGVGDESKSTPDKDSKKWVRIHDATTGESIPFPLENAVAPESDGPVDITLFLKDDMGNVSIPVLLDSIMYDNTKPTVTLLDNYGDFVKSDGSKDLHASKETVIRQILKVSFTEPNENNAGSGIRRMEIHVKKGNTEVEVPLSQDASNPFKVKWTSKTGSAANPADAKEIKIAANDEASTNNIKVFDVNDSSKITTGTLFIYGITLGDEDGNYTVLVDLFDSAMNQTPATAKTLIALDTTAPEIEQVKVVDVQARTVYGDTTETKTWWLPKDKFENSSDVNSALNKVSLTVKVDEFGSGLEVLKVSKDIEFTAQTKLKLGTAESEEYLMPDVDYQLDYVNNTIKLLNNYNVILKGTSESPIVFTLENVKFKKINNASGNKVALEVVDFVQNAKSNKAQDSADDYQVYYNDTTTGTLVFADSTPPQITELRIEDSAHNDQTNPYRDGGWESGWDKDNYTDSRVVALVLTLKAEDLTNGSGVKTIHLSDNAEFTSSTKIYVDDATAPLTSSEYSIAADKKSVTFTKVFTAANVIRFENVQIVSDAEGYQTVKADLTDFVGLDTVASKESSIITYDSIAPVINEDGINWIPDNSLVSYGNVQTEEVTDQTLKVDFTEETAGVKVIRFDIDYEGGADSYEWPFSLHDFNLLYNGSSIDFNRSSDGRYLLLKNPFKSGTFEFKNIKLRDDPLEGKYNVKITLLDAAENKNPQDSSAVYKKEIFMDTTAPVINEVRVIDAKPRTVYGDSARTTTWWMPYEKFDETKTNLSKVTFQISVDEAGTGLKYIKLAQDIEFTNDTKLFIGSQELVKNTDYTLDVSTKTITLLNHREPKLKGTAAAPETVFTLQNVKLNKINTNAGNKAALTVFDFVNNFGSNRAEGSTDDYTVYYDNTTTTGTLIYADNTPPAIATLYIEDSAQNTTTNPDNKAYDKDNYTNTQDVILTLTLSAENATDGSGVKTIQLSDNAEFTNATTITVDDILLPASDYTFAADNKSVDFDNVFTQANVIKFTNVHIISAEEGAQIVKADLTDFVGINTTASTDSNEIIFDSVNPVVTAINWNTTDPLVAKGKVQTQDVTDQTLSVDFTEETAGTKVIRFDIDYENAPDSDSYETPFDLSNFEIKYGNTTLVKDTDYTISDGRYIILNQPKYSGTFNFNNLKIRDTNDEGEYTIKITLLDAAENKNPQAESSVFKKSIFMDTTAPVVSSVTVAGAQARTVYGDASETKTWWLPYSKFEAKNNLSKVDLNIAVNEAGSGLKIIKLSQDVEFTENTQLLAGGVQLTKGTDYALDLTNHTITLFNYDNPVLRNTTGANGAITYSQFTLKNVKLNRINTSAGNTVGFTVADWVANAGSNQIDSTSDYKIYYNSIENGTRIFADDTEPEITAIKIEDSAQESSVNPDNKAYDKTHYTNTQDVVLTLSLKAESLSNGSGVKTIHLSNNAEFTSSTQIFVDDATDALTSGDSGDYTIAQDNKSVTFKKVFTDANVIKFTNVHIISSTQGEQTLGADLTDFVGLNTVQSKSPDSLIYDSVAPVVSSIHWVTNQPGVTLGSDKDWKVDTQALQIAFTEATAGVKVIKFDIHLLDQTASYANPFENTDFALSYNGTVLAKGTDYTITADDSSNSAARYIILASPKPTGTFKFENLQLNNQEIEGTYVIDVALLDAAENRVNTTKSIAIDKVVPVITEDIRIPNLIEAYQLTTSGIGSTKEYWLPTSYINGTVKAPDAIPVYVKIQENGSGIKVITFGNNATLSANTTLWMVASDGTETAVPSSYYEVNSTNKTITIIDSNNALNAGAAVADFEILVKNVGFANTDSAYGDTNAHFSSNSINVKVSDVAMNETAVRGTTETLIYSDSRTPAKPTEFKLLDRASATDGSSTDGAPSIEAEENYTNDSIVNMEFNLDTSEVYGSGYHQFVITNASFIPESTTVEMTKISPSGSGSISGIAFVLSEDNKTLTLKTNDAEPKNLVVRDAVKVTIKNVQLDNATSGDNKSVTVKVRDLIGRESPVATDDIWFDNTKPELYKLFAANYSKDTSTSCPEYYKPAINVYPHADVENAEGVLANYGTESSPKNIPTFYTATTYNTDYTYYTYKGQLSRSSSSLLQDFTYGAVLGFHATDNTKLSGYVSAATTFLHYIQDDDFTKTASDILGTSINSGRKNPATDINNNTTRQYESLWFGIPTGHYSAVIVDEAGNVSDVFRFAVVKDTEKPTTTNLNDRVLFARPGEDYNVYRNTAAAPSDESAFENGFKASSSITSGVNGGGIRTKKFVTKETSDKKYKLILKLGENYNASNLITNMQGESVSSSISTSKYEDLDGTSSSAPIEQYLISTWYGEWPSSYQSQGTHGYSYAYKPLVPNGTTFPSGQTLNTTSTLSTTDYQDVRNYFGYSDAFTSRMRVYDNGSNPYTSWHSYSHPAGSDGTKYTDYGNSITSYVDSDNNLVIELPPKSTAPVSVFLRDGCGNMTYVVCGLETEQSGSYTWTETTENPDDPENPVSTLHTVNYTYQVAPSFIIDNWLGWKQTTNGVNMEPIIRQNPHMLYVSSSSNVRWPDWTLTSTTGYAGYKWSYNTGNGDQGGEGEAFGHIKDHVKKATYYNPNISDNRTTVTNSSDNKFKLGLTLYFKQSDEDGSGTDSTVHPEDILWDTSLGKTDSTTDYSTRALLYCTQSSNRPDYDDIVKSHRYDQVSYGDTGFRTDWTAIRIS